MSHKRRSCVEDISTPKSKCPTDLPLQLNYYITPSVFYENITPEVTLNYEIQNRCKNIFKQFIVIVDSAVGTPYNYGVLELGPNEVKLISVKYTIPIGTSGDIISSAFVARVSKRKAYGTRISNLDSSKSENGSSSPSFINTPLNFSLAITPDVYTPDTPLTLRANITNTTNKSVSYDLEFVASVGILRSVAFDLGVLTFEPNETKTIRHTYSLIIEELALALILVSGFLQLKTGQRISNISTAQATASSYLPIFAIKCASSNEKHTGSPYYNAFFTDSSQNTSGYFLDPITNTVNLNMQIVSQGEFCGGPRTCTAPLVWWDPSVYPKTIGPGGVGNTRDIFRGNCILTNATTSRWVINGGEKSSIPTGALYYEVDTRSSGGRDPTWRSTVSFQLADTDGNQIVAAVPSSGTLSYSGPSSRTLYDNETWTVHVIDTNNPDTRPGSNDSLVSMNVSLNQYGVKLIDNNQANVFSGYTPYDSNNPVFQGTVVPGQAASVGLLGGILHSGNYGYTAVSPNSSATINPQNINPTIWVIPSSTINF